MAAFALGEETKVRFERAGVFHQPRVGVETWRAGITVPKDVSFSKLRVSINAKVGPWNDKDGKTNHAVLWLNRGTKWRSNVLGYVNIFGPDRPRVKMANNLGQAPGVMLSQQMDWQAKEGQTYRFEYVYDAGAGRVELTVRHVEKVVATLADTAKVEEMVFEEGLMRVIIGHPGTDVGPEAPTYGWAYSGLVVEIE